VRWGVLLALLLGGCATTARVTGDYGEYASYRRTRLAFTLEDRLGASERYLRDYPDGAYHEEVRRWFTPAEKRYFKLAWNNLPRLRAYLDEMPRGPHAEAVSERISALESRRVFAERREQRFNAHVSGIAMELDQAARQRREFLHEFAALAGALGAVRGFGEPTSELGSELLLRFRVRQPPGTCSGDLCQKDFAFPYAVPNDQALASRVAQAKLEITLARGLVQTVSLSGPELLSRVAEAVEVRVVPAGNPQARAEALGHALDVLEEALEAPLPKATCGAEVVSPTILKRHCNGVTLSVIAAVNPGEPDRVTVGAETP